MINLDAIRKKIAMLNKTGTGIWWKPKAGNTYTIRILPWENLKSGTIFEERFFYYNLQRGGIVSPGRNFKKPDPVQELISKLRETNDPKDAELAKKLYPKLRAFAPIIVRGEENKGVQLFSFGETIYNRLLSFFVNEEMCREITENITDLDKGLDLIVKVEQKAGKKFVDYTVDHKLKASKAHNDPAVVKQWMASLPIIDQLFPLKSYEELEKILNDWLNADNPNPGEIGDSSSEDSSSVTKKAGSDLDDMLKDLE